MSGHHSAPDDSVCWRVDQVSNDPLSGLDVISQVPQHISIAFLAEQPAHDSAYMVVIDREVRPGTGSSSADVAGPSLMGEDLPVLLGGDSVCGSDVPAVVVLAFLFAAVAIVRRAPRPWVRGRPAGDNPLLDAVQAHLSGVRRHADRGWSWCRRSIPVRRSPCRKDRPCRCGSSPSRRRARPARTRVPACGVSSRLRGHE